MVATEKGERKRSRGEGPEGARVGKEGKRWAGFEEVSNSEDAERTLEIVTASNERSQLIAK